MTLRHEALLIKIKIVYENNIRLARDQELRMKAHLYREMQVPIAIIPH